METIEACGWGMRRAFPYATVLALSLMVVVAWRVTGVFPTEATLSPWWFSRDGLLAGEHHRWFTSLVTHGGILHLLFNVIALASLAPLERDLGTPRFLTVLILAGLGGNLAHAFTTTMPAVGASGSIFGLLGLLVALAPGTRLSLLGLPVPAIVLLPGYAALVLLVPGLQELAPIAHMAHLGGLTVGLIAGFAFAPTRAIEHLAYALVTFAAVGVIVLNLQTVGIGAVLHAVLEQDLLTVIMNTWPTLAALGVLAWIAYRIPQAGSEDSRWAM